MSHILDLENLNNFTKRFQVCLKQTPVFRDQRMSSARTGFILTTSVATLCLAGSGAKCTSTHSGAERIWSCLSLLCYCSCFDLPEALNSTNTLIYNSSSPDIFGLLPVTIVSVERKNQMQSVYCCQKL